MFAGLGTDIVEVQRIAEMIERHGEHFLERTFTDGERAYCDRHKNSAQNYAGRWAAKEAAMKALGTGFIKGIRWTEVEVVNLKSGAPKLVLHGGTKEFALKLGIAEIAISISHSKEYATSTAIALRGVATREQREEE
ncbi:holo-ACP synthase [Stratiformator vulcanicus]|uniref:Holo-[acyl-carrier-protein] synthase n=1 Tax=Stratiformator vulcanicus TaxID=2527980 RepID=A0A517QZN2_9PLAN|nr:holo-ACP synthase [Stratiformator vulcanicus]QDT37064.1 Holo-[acyl-carrier-protein] synthase [Stratiformator vulcanicus]